jgi:tRNA 2-thiouridine synthesizing protein A
MNDALLPVESQRADAVLAYVEHVQDTQCVNCAVTLCGHLAVMNLLIGFKDAPRCLSCLSAALDRNRQELRDHLLAYINHQECYHAGWRWASGREGFDPNTLPACLWGSGEKAATTPPDGVGLPPSDTPRQLFANAEWDAGEMGCGDLVLELRARLQSINPGEVLKVTARDPGAPEDLPAWCRLTGHALALWRHPEYWIRRKER